MEEEEDMYMYVYREKVLLKMPILVYSGCCLQEDFKPADQV